MGYPVIGGPRRPSKLPDECTFPVGTYVATEGHAIKQWPWRAGSEIVGMVARERTKNGGVFHMYRLMDGQWRYAGKAMDQEEAKRRLLVMHERAQEATLAVQPVAPVNVPAPRRRRSA